MTEDEVLYNKLIIEGIFGSCGVEGMTVDEFMAGVEEEWAARPDLKDELVPNYIAVAVLVANEVLENLNEE